MKIAIITTLAISLLSSTAFIPTALASTTAQREARMAEIEALYYAVREGRMKRSDRIQALLDIARLEAEQRKDLR